jgi:polyhydroxybutyrate depolymerase
VTGLPDLTGLQPTTHIRTQEAGNDAAAAATAAATAAAAAAAPISSGCPAASPGDHYGFLMHDGLPRRYLIHIPPQAATDPNKPLPLVVNLHGMPFLLEWSEVVVSGLNDKADAEGFAVVYPVGFLSLFNAGACCSPEVDDVGFIRTLLQQELPRHYCIDPRRIYATGVSGGGMMVYKVACDAADLFAAVAVVGGARITDPCVPTRPVPLIHFHGTGDTNVRAG